MRIKNWSILYTLGYGLVSVGQRAFYKKTQVVGLENVPRDKPIIFCSNHQNAFMDPILIGIQLHQPTYWLVRADVFKKPLVAKIFESINMMPVYRERDGVNTKQANVEVFNRCFDILQKNRPIVIFPEGNHGRQKTLRPLKKGFARIASGAEAKHGKDIEVQIVPVGLNYSDHYNMGAELLIVFEKPIKANDYLKETDNALQVNEIKKELENSMSSSMIDIQLKQYYNTIHEMMMMFEHELVGSNATIHQKFIKQKAFIDKAESYLSQNPSETLEEEAEKFKKEIQDNGLRYWLFADKKHSIFLSALGLILFAPVHLYGVLNNYAPYRIPVWFVNTKIKDPQFQSSMKMAMGVILFAVFWSIQTLLVSLFTDGWALWYLLSLPISAWISYHYWVRLLKTRGMMRFNKMAKDHSLKKKYEEFKSLFSKMTSSS